MIGNVNKRGWRASASSLAMGVALGVALMVTQPAMAAETTSGLQGHVTSAPSGSKVTVVNNDNGAKVTVKVREDGSYAVVGLRPGNYQVSFVAPDGKAVRQDITLVVGETAELDGDFAQAQQEVTVVGRRKEVRTSELSTNVSRSQIETMPQDNRNFLNLAALAPGVTVSLDPNNKQFSAGGVEATQVNVFIDGQSQKNQVIMGGIAGQDSSRGDPFPLSAIQEYKVSTQNFKAEYEQAGSAIITAVTKSGGNEFHGSVYAIERNKAMSGQPKYQRNTSKPDYKRDQYGIELSGPIVKDKLFFYITHEHTNETFPSDSVNIKTNVVDTGTGKSVDTANPALATYLKGLNGAFAREFSEDLTFGKLTWTPDAYNTFDLSLMNRQEDNLKNFGNSQAYSQRRNENQYVRQGSLQWKYRGETMINELSLEYQSYHWGQFAVNDSIPINLNLSATDRAGVAQIGGANWVQEKAQDSITFKDYVTFTGVEWNGAHVIKAGIKFANYEYTADEGDRNALFYNAQTYVAGNTTQQALYARVMDGNPVLTASNAQLGLFIQDDWTVDEHLTYNLGVRWDYETNMTNSDFITPAEIATALRGYNNWKLAGINAEDYISDGKNRDPFLGAFQPRVGFSYDLHGDRQTVIFGGFGRYYDRTLYDRSQLEIRRATIHSGIEVKFTAPGTEPCVGGTTTVTHVACTTATSMPWNTAYGTDLTGVVGFAHQQGIKGEVFLMPNDVKMPYSDQFDFGVRHQFGSINTSATFSHVQYNDVFRFLVGNRQADGSWGNAWCGTHGPTYGCTPWGDGLSGYGSILIGDNSEKTTLNAIYLTAEKPYTKASGYSWSVKLDLNDSTTNGTNQWLIGQFASPKYQPKHKSEGVKKWNLVATGRYDLPYEFILSGVLYLNSGDPQVEFINPATTTGGELWRYGAYWPKDPYTELDARLAKSFTLPNGNVIEADFVVTNLFDSVNRTYSEWGGGNGTLTTPPTHKPEQNTYGPPRQFQVGLKYKW